LFDALTIPNNRTRTLILLAICALLAIAAVVIGIDDNPPGILLAFLADITFVLAFAHPWRTARQFRLLLFASLIGFVLFAILNNIFAVVAHSPATTGALQYLMQVLAVAAFILASMISPAAFMVSLVGLVAVFIRNRRRSASTPPAVE